MSTRIFVFAWVGGETPVISGVLDYDEAARRSTFR